VAVQVMGNDTAIMVSGQAGNFELLVMLPVMAHNLLQSIALMARAAENFAVRCVEGLRANPERCRAGIEQSLAMCTALVPEIGYEAAAEIAKEAFRTGKTIRQVALEKKVLPAERLAHLMSKQGHEVVVLNRDIKFGGLAEYGIFPNKHKLRGGLRKGYWEVLTRPNVRYFGNVTVGNGYHLAVSELRALGPSALVFST